ncbi:hypothetical protein [Mesorhizobium sp.]|uniref:hypothetical protein n=1 Tax=Mesorhizobium sp. TaxID=1871066 RepID=UPI000FE9938A|nr:hypothetical protein [Mesorhizobium sp.]RWH31642.1 MAG: hypothetical protein EOQ76_07385 [Mesorhizobium sp.]
MARPHPTHSLRGALIVGATIAAIAFILFVICGGLANAHDAEPTSVLPQGWSYPFACCANYDCRQATGEMKEEPDGYHTPSGEVIPYSDKRIKLSPDGEFHWCAHQAGLDAGKTICLFVPDRGT